MNRKALFLSSVMLRGHGVSVVAHEIGRRLGTYGWDLVIGCLEVDDDFLSDRVVKLPADPNQLIEFCMKESIEVVAAQTSPYFECLPALARVLPTVVYEHGDPTPTFFADDAHERENIRRHKIQEVYPNVNVVAASSHFLAHDIEWPQAKICTLGCNHVDDLGPKTSMRFQSASQTPLRVGTLMRLGSGETQYKGNELFIDLIERLRKSRPIEPCLMGRGTEDDRQYWEQKGFEVHLNASDAERETYLRSLDVFVSSSQWEGFNLPLVEAQALGTLSLAYDVGAHPETTPFVMPSILDAEAFILAVDQDHELLLNLSDLGRRYVRNKFEWERTSAGFAEILELARSTGPNGRGLVSHRRSIPKRLSALVRREGVRAAGQIIVKRLWTRMGRH